jgi:hypothetical protein
VVVKDRISRYAADAERRAYLEELARGNADKHARLRAGAPVVPAADAGGTEEEPAERPLSGDDAPSSNDLSTGGDKADVDRGFSSYSAVGHYVPEAVGEETQRGR